jgi:hypothetical protein
MAKEDDGWYGVDLDGCLAYYDHWRGPDHIGEPIRPMLDRVRGWIKAGREVKIVTARATIPEQVKPVTEWLKQQKLFKKGTLKPLEVTASKDFKMALLFDDRCRQVETNTGKLIGAEA